MTVDAIIKAGGGPSRIGRQLGLHHASVIEWRKAGQVPVAHVLKLEEITGIPRHQMRPDIYPPPAGAGDPPDKTTDPAAYGSLRWLTAQRDRRPAVDISSVELLNGLHDED